MRASGQDVVSTEGQLLGREQEAQAVMAATDALPILQYANIGSSLANFISQLVGGKTGTALDGAAGAVNGFGIDLLHAAQETQKILTGVDEGTHPVDTLNLSDLLSVHARITSYVSAFPNGVPQIAVSANVNYAIAGNTTARVLNHFQTVSNRGPIASIPVLCHATNTRMELAISAWPCWYVQSSPAQPDFNGELNLSNGMLSGYISVAQAAIGNQIRVKQLMKKLDPDLPPQTVGWQVIDDNKVVWTKMDPDAAGEAQTEKKKRQQQKVQEILGGYFHTRDQWANMSARFAPAGIARALELGDATTFLRYVNPSTLVMEEPEESARAAGVVGKSPVYRALPMRDILLDMLTSDAMRARHGLLVRSADKRAVSTWFEKTFFRRPSPAELAALVEVTALFGNGALFGCLAWSDEYKTRFGDGIPGPVDRPSPAPVPSSGAAEVA